MPIALTIAGFDPSSGAGATADLQVFAAHSFWGLSCLTALTVQSTQGVRRSVSVDPHLIEEMLGCLVEDTPPAGVKIGMLGTAANVRVVAGFLERFRQTAVGRVAPVVLDPVIRSSSGAELLDADGVVELRHRLFPLVDWVTPNVAELAVLLGEREESEPAELERQGKGLQSHFGARGVLVTGGHLPEPNDLLISTAREVRWVLGERVETRSTHGTGCAFSSALLCNLINGMQAVEAVTAAKHYVTQAMRTAQPIGKGKGPMNILWPLLRS